MPTLTVVERCVYTFDIDESDAKKVEKMTSTELVKWLDKRYRNWCKDVDVEDRDWYIEHEEV